MENGRQNGRGKNISKHKPCGRTYVEEMEWEQRQGMDLMGGKWKVSVYSSVVGV